MTRRQAISKGGMLAGGIVGGLVVGGLAGYYLHSPGSAQTVTSTVNNTVTNTVTSTQNVTTSVTSSTTGYNPVPDSFWTTSNPLYPDHKVTLKFWRSGGFPHDDIVAKVTEVFPNITIEATDSQDESQILSVAQTGSYVYDMFRIQMLNFEGMIASGNVVDLAQVPNCPVTQWNTNWPDWVQTNMAGNFGQPGVQYFAVPEDSGPNCFIYRQDLFAKYNLTVPTTWAEFKTQAESIHSQDSNEYLAWFSPGDTSGMAEGLMWQAGGKHLVPVSPGKYAVETNSAVNKQFIEYWGGLIDEGVVSNVNTYTTEWGNQMDTGVLASTAEGPGWMMGSHMLFRPAQSGLWRVADIPQWTPAAVSDPTQFRSSNIGGSCIGVLKQSPEPAACALVALALTEFYPAAWQAVQESIWPLDAKFVNYIAPQYSAYELSYFNQDVLPFYEKAVSHIDHTWHYTKYESSIQTILSAEWGKAASGQQSWDASLASIDASITALVQQSGDTIVPAP